MNALPEEQRNNRARYYYLESSLTEAEWRIFSDLVQVYPYMSESQTKKFLSVLGRMRLAGGVRQPVRYV